MALPDMNAWLLNFQGFAESSGIRQAKLVTTFPCLINTAVRITEMRDGKVRNRLLLLGMISFLLGETRVHS
jgi:hypothetical protein